MATSYSIDVQVRTIIGKKVARLRREGILPATVYGKGVTPISIQLEARAFGNTFRHAGRTALVELKIPGEATLSAFIHAIQRHPVSRQITHVDFRVVNLREEITVEVPITFTGESLLVAREDAVLNQMLNSLQVRALPASLPQHIEVDIGVLNELGKSVHVRDLATSGDYTILNDADDVIVALSASRMASDEEEAAEGEAEGTSEPEESGEGDDE